MAIFMTMFATVIAKLTEIKVAMFALVTMRVTDITVKYHKGGQVQLGLNECIIKLDYNLFKCLRLYYCKLEHVVIP